MRRLFLALLLLAGCLDEHGSTNDDPPVAQPHSLAEFPDLGVRELTFSGPTPDDDRTVTVSLTYAGIQYHCYAIKDPVTVTIAGFTGTVQDVGHWRFFSALADYPYTCEEPKFVLTLPPTVTGPQQVHVSDPSLDATFDITLPP